jgi:hypothetical protein
MPPHKLNHAQPPAARRWPAWIYAALYFWALATFWWILTLIFFLRAARD